jgi:phospholipid/cholesterol/gamma-HCH transport system substrate-binding protein
MGTVQDLGTQLSKLLEDFQNNQLALLSASLEIFNSLAGKIDDRSEAELERVSRILESAALIAEQTEAFLRERSGDAGGAVKEMYGALENIRLITGEIRQGQGNISRTIYDDHLYTKVLSTVEKTEQTAEKLQETLDSVKTLAQSADRVVNDAGEIVARASGLGFQVDTNARYDLLSRQIKAGASLMLLPVSNDRWYRIGVSSATEGVTTHKLVETKDKTGNDIAYEDISETRYEIAVDAELARIFGPLTLRGGVLENSAGLGVDFRLLQWLNLSTEVFNLNGADVPNLRGTLTIYPFFDPQSNAPWNWIYLKGGINNSLNADTRDYFLGGGVRFADREVKGLVGILPGF